MVLSKKTLILIAIITIGTALRLVDLGGLPPGLYFDEVLYGLDAYSLLSTGRDLYGKFLPLAFQSSGYYPPAYPYILAPFIALGGLSPFTVRLPAALAGSATILGIYLIANITRYKHLGLWAALLLATSPWHIHLSRVAFLGGFGVVWVTFGTYFLLTARNHKQVIISAFLFAVSTQIHYGYQLLAPILFATLFYIRRHKLKVSRLFLITLSLIWIVTFTISALSYIKFQTSFRVKQLIHPPSVSLVKTWAESYLPEWKVQGGYTRLANPWGQGRLLFILVPFLWLGLLKLHRLKLSLAIALYIYLIITPLPSVLAGDAKHLIRNSPLLIPLAIISALGIHTFLGRLGRQFRRLAFLFIIALITVETSRALLYYWRDYPHEYATLWGQPQTTAIMFAQYLKPQYSNIVFTDNFHVMLSYWAFITRIPPHEIQLAITQPISSLGNAYFIPSSALTANFSLPENSLLLSTHCLKPSCVISDSSYQTYHNDLPAWQITTAK